MASKGKFSDRDAEYVVFKVHLILK